MISENKLEELKSLKQNNLAKTPKIRRKSRKVHKSRNTLKSFYSTSSIKSTKKSPSSISSNMSRTFAELQKSHEKKFRNSSIPQLKIIKPDDDKPRLLPLKNLKKLITQI
jgi:hypothetical protein